MSKLNSFVALLLCLLFSVAAEAQLPSLKGFGSNSGAAADMGASQTSLIRSYVGASKDVLAAQAKMLDALGKKDEAAKAQATADALSDGATKDSLQDAQKIVSDSSKQIQEEEKKKAGSMDAQSKKTYTQGLVYLASAIVKYNNMRKDIDAFKSGLSGAPVMQAAKLQTGAYIVTTFPGNLQNLTATMSDAVTFAKNNGIEVPPEATSAI